MGLSKVRIDPPQGVFVLRGYSEAASPVPLNEEMRAYKTIGSMIISGHIATVSALIGDLEDIDLWTDLDKELLRLGVTELHWNRHKNGKVLTKKRRVTSHV